MALSLHGLRMKIAAAAVVRYGAGRASALPAGQRAVLGAARRIQPGAQDEESGSYRGLLAQMLRESATGENRGAEQGLVYDPIAGLVSGPVASARDTAAAQERYDQDPADPAAQWRLGRALFAAGQTGRGLELMEAAAAARPTAATLLALAAACRKPYIGRFEQAFALYQQALALNPNDLRAVEGIINTGARSRFDWPLIWAGAAKLKPTRGPLAAPQLWAQVEPLFTQEPTESEVAAAEAALQAVSRQAHRLHQLLLEVLIVRLQFLRRFRLARDLRDAMARNRIKELRGIPLESALWLKHLLGGYAQLDQLSKAAAIATRPPVHAATELSRFQLEKLRADVALMTGDAGPLQAHAATRRAQFPLPGDSAMLELVQGRRVAVVGPAATTEEFGALVDSYDVVVRTRARGRVTPEEARRGGSRTDIAYYNGRDLGAMWQDAGRAAEDGELRLAVARPFYATLVDSAPDWLRFTRSEFGLYFRGASLGLQRMIYDLLQFAPTEIALFGADFYAGARSYPPGYRTHDGFGPDSPLNDIVMVHDLVFERRLMQAFCATGLLTPHGVAAEVLELTDAQYIDRLERGTGLR